MCKIDTLQLQVDHLTRIQHLLINKNLINFDEKKENKNPKSKTKEVTDSLIDSCDLRFLEKTKKTVFWNLICIFKGFRTKKLHIGSNLRLRCGGLFRI